MPAVLPAYSDAITRSLRCSEYVDDFHKLDTGIWTQTKDTEGSGAIDGDDACGILNLATGAVDNNEIYEETAEFFAFTAGKPFGAILRAKITESAAGIANILFGFMDAPGANSLVDNGAGPQADFDGAVFYKVDGGTRWKVRASQDTVYTGTDHETETALAASFFTLGIEVHPISSTQADIIYLIDPLGGNDLYQPRRYGSLAPEPPIKHRLTLSTPTEMALVIGLKAGSATGETLKVDLCEWWQVR
jgi:hypothetical protein